MKWSKTKNVLVLQANWRIGLLFHMKPKANDLCKCMGNLGMRTSSFDNPDELFQHLLEKKDIRLIFCDWEPQKDSQMEIGTKFLTNYRNFARSHSIVQNIPIILVTYHFTGQDLLPAIRLGARDILIMPTTDQILGQKILENLNKVEKKPQMLKESEELMNKSEECIRVGDYRGAIKIYEKVIREQGNVAGILEKQAEAHIRAGQIEEAIECFKKCVALEKSNVRAYQGLGNCYCQLGLHRKAREFYKKVIEIEPENAYVDHKIGRTYMMENNLRGAERHYEVAIQRHPHFYEICKDLADIKHTHEQPDEATGILRKYIDQYPDDMRGHISYAESLINAGHYQEAESAIEHGIDEAIKEKFEPPVALYNRWGIALRKQEKYQAAIQKYELALKIEPDSAEIRFNIAKAYFESGDHSKKNIERFAKCFETDQTLQEDLWDDKLLAPLHKYFPKPN